MPQGHFAVEDTDLLFRALGGAGMGYLTYDFMTGRVVPGPCLVAMSGLPQGEIAPVDLHACIHPGDRVRVRQELEAASRQPQPAPAIRFRYFRPRDGALRWLSMVVAFEMENGGLPRRGLALIRDVTETVRSEERLALLNERLEEAVHERVSELERTYERLRLETEERQRSEASLRQLQKMDMLGQLTSGIAHDFNNFLQVILGSLAAAERHGLDGKGAALVRAAHEAARHCAKLVQQLLAFARRQQLKQEVVDVGRAIHETRPWIERALGPGNSLEITVPDDLWSATADGSQLASTLLNLAINARDAMLSGGTLAIQAENRTLAAGDPARPVDLEPGDYIRISVVDSGSGMAPDVLQRVFEPFFTTKAPGQGTGLGLSMVYGLIRQLGGTVSIASELGTGTTVTLFLRRAPAT